MFSRVSPRLRTAEEWIVPEDTQARTVPAAASVPGLKDDASQSYNLVTSPFHDLANCHSFVISCDKMCCNLQPCSNYKASVI